MIGNGDSVLCLFLFFPFWLYLKLVHCFLFSEASVSYSQTTMDDEYEKFIRRMNPPRYVLLTSFYESTQENASVLLVLTPILLCVDVRVVIDNESCKNATVIQVCHCISPFLVKYKLGFSGFAKFTRPILFNAG